LNRIKGEAIRAGQVGPSMAVHRISLAGALLMVLLAIVFLVLIGPLGLLVLVVAAVLIWYAVGPGARSPSVRGA